MPWGCSVCNCAVVCYIYIYITYIICTVYLIKHDFNQLMLLQFAGHSVVGCNVSHRDGVVPLHDGVLAEKAQQSSRQLRVHKLGQIWRARVESVIDDLQGLMVNGISVPFPRPKPGSSSTRNGWNPACVLQSPGCAWWRHSAQSFASEVRYPFSERISLTFSNKRLNYTHTMESRLEYSHRGVGKLDFMWESKTSFQPGSSQKGRRL